MKAKQTELFQTQPDEITAVLSGEDFLRLARDTNWQIAWIDVLKPSGYRVKARRVQTISETDTKRNQIERIEL